METKIYKPRKLINGYTMGLQGGQYVAIPDKGFKKAKIVVIYEGKEMVIPNWHKAITFRKFHDQFGGKDYTLGYFKWE